VSVSERNKVQWRILEESANAVNKVRRVGLMDPRRISYRKRSGSRHSAPDCLVSVTSDSEAAEMNHLSLKIAHFATDPID